MPTEDSTRASDSRYPFTIWLVLYVDRHALKSSRRVAGAFTTEVEARKLERELHQLEDSGSFRYEVESTHLWKRSDDWRPDPENLPYGSVPGLHKATAILPEFKGHQCLTMSRITSMHGDGTTVTEGLEIGWKTGAHVQLGVARPGTLLITPEPWSPPVTRLFSVVRNADEPARASGQRSSHAIAREDPLTVLLGEKVHGFSVTENRDGSINAIKLTFKPATLDVRVENDQFLVQLTER
ncbi:hypothetical protein GCM10009623_32620 [Nocardioides aestuarii]|uniref:Uncharacterized protein n=1 Tax=Nocardioides aestuarii TaxID=252231 RepID=A0ABW4TR31_9ACTN